MQIRTKQIADLLTTCVPITGSTLDVDLNGKILSNLLTPLLIGGTAVGSTLTYKTTTGIGTTGAHIFQVGNNGATEAMRILNNGNVGISNPTPTSKLEVYKNSTSTVIGNDATFSLTNTSATNNNFSSLFFQDANTFPVGQVSVQITDHTNHIADLVFATRSGVSGALYTEKLRILSSGRVGIGLTAPTAVLHLKAGTATASTAPLKFTSGALNTVSVAGCVEFLTDAYYATITTGSVRKTFAFLESNAVNNKGINVTFDGQGIVIPLNTNSIIAAAATNGTITAWFIEGDVSGSIVVDILKNGVSMSGAGNKPTLASALTANAAVSGWTSLSFATNDKLEIKVTTASTTLTKCYLTIKYNIS